MIVLYTWIPKAVEALQAGVLPDLGHSALQVSDTYMSFWPELDSLVGRATSALKPRTYRNPACYELEADPGAPFMQRTADYADTLRGFSEAPMLAAWAALHDEPYDFSNCNCSHVALSVLRAGLDPAARKRLDALDGDCRPEEAELDPLEDACRVVRELLAAPITGCTPEAVRMRVAQVARQDLPAGRAEEAEQRAARTLQDALPWTQRSLAP